MEKSINQCDVLVIEDEQALSELVRINLISRNISTIIAETGIEGISLALRRHPRIILLDIILPDIDGWQVCRFFKNNNMVKQPAIVFMTASIQKKDKEDAQRLSCDGFLEKPFEITELIRIVNRFIR